MISKIANTDIDKVSRIRVLPKSTNSLPKSTTKENKNVLFLKARKIKKNVEIVEKVQAGFCFAMPGKGTSTNNKEYYQSKQKCFVPHGKEKGASKSL